YYYSILFGSFLFMFFFFSSRRRHTRLQGDWSSDVCSSDLIPKPVGPAAAGSIPRTRVQPSPPLKVASPMAPSLRRTLDSRQPFVGVSLQLFHGKKEKATGPQRPQEKESLVRADSRLDFGFVDVE